jgi:predicted dehydrogenase
MLHTDVDDQFTARLRTKDDVIISMEVTWSAQEYRLPETYIEVHGSKGQLTVTEDYLKVKTLDPHELLNGRNELQIYKPQYYQNLPPVNLSDPEYTLENMHFLSSVEKRNEPLTSIKSVAQTMQLIDEMYTMADASDGH